MSESWRIGILFSRSGVTGATESEHFRGAALAVEEINRAGGVLGLPVEPVAYDPGATPAGYRAAADRLLGTDGVNVIFGCSTSSCRKAVLPAVERRNGLLWYPSLYEGFEYSPNVIYTGAVPNQLVYQLAAWMAREHGPRVACIGSDYIYPREMNRVMRDVAERLGGGIALERYVSMEADAATVGEAVAALGRIEADWIFSTVVGEPALDFHRALADAGPRRPPVASLTLDENMMRRVGPGACEGLVNAATYLATIATEANERFVAAYRARFGAEAVTGWYSASSYAQVHLFARALEAAGSLDTQRLVEASLGLACDTPEGRILIEPENQHAWLTPRIGIARGDGLFEIVWEARAPIRPDPYLTESPAPGSAWIAD